MAWCLSRDPVLLEELTADLASRAERRAGGVSFHFAGEWMATLAAAPQLSNCAKDCADAHRRWLTLPTQ